MTNIDESIMIKADHVHLHIPVIKYSEQKLTINPVRLLSGVYANKSKRQVKILLDDLSFELKKGDRVGVIGRNGAGKTTLLRLLSGVYKHSGGELTINGDANGLYDVQLGINPEATGIENIYLRGLQMGLSLAEIRDFVEPVVEFAELGDAINDIFGTYSTGMKLRLTVAISTMIKPDILIMDEWIGSGDESFRLKINRRMDSIIDDASGLVIATHSTHLMKELCTKAIVLDAGRIQYFGDINGGLQYYAEEIVRHIPEHLKV